LSLRYHQTLVKCRHDKVGACWGRGHIVAAAYTACFMSDIFGYCWNAPKSYD